MGDRVRLRRLRDDDRRWLLELAQDPDGALVGNAGPPEPWSEADLDAYLERHARSLLYAIETVPGGELVGRCILKDHDHKNRHAAVGVTLHPDHWDRGYGTQAVALLVDHGFRHYDLHKVKLDVAAVNERAVAVYEKLGFQVDAREREARYRDGGYVDVLDMSLRRTVWDAVRDEFLP